MKHPSLDEFDISETTKGHLRKRGIATLFPIQVWLVGDWLGVSRHSRAVRRALRSVSTMYFLLLRLLYRVTTNLEICVAFFSFRSPHGHVWEHTE